MAATWRVKPAFEQAIALKPDGIILNGADAVSLSGQSRRRCAGSKSGWHVGGGQLSDLASLCQHRLRPIATSKIAAKYVIAQTNGKATVIFTD
jgi:hypothetical protein